MITRLLFIEYCLIFVSFFVSNLWIELTWLMAASVYHRDECGYGFEYQKKGDSVCQYSLFNVRDW